MAAWHRTRGPCPCAGGIRQRRCHRRRRCRRAGYRACGVAPADRAVWRPTPLPDANWRTCDHGDQVIEMGPRGNSAVITGNGDRDREDRRGRDPGPPWRGTGIDDLRWQDLRHTWAELARAEGQAAVRGAGIGRLRESRDGAALCAPRRGWPRGLRGTHLRREGRRGTQRRNKSGTGLQTTRGRIAATPWCCW